MKRTARIRWFAGLLLAGVGSPLHAQVVRGRVVDADAKPLRGVVVMATSPTGRDTVQALTSTAGQFELRWARSSDTISFRLLRLGFRPMTGQSIALRAGVVETPDFVFESPAIALARVDIRASSTCRLMTDSAMLVSRVWDEVDKALVVESMARDGNTMSAEWARYQRTESRRGSPQQTRTLELYAGNTQRVFRSRPSGEIAREGYVTRVGDTTTFVAPDPDVFRSAVFRQTHCFALREDRERGAMIGVEFRPATARDGIVDISGIAWLSTAPWQLLHIDFAYEGLPGDVPSADRGGTVALDTLEGGEWLITSWRVRFPRVVRRASTSVRLSTTAALSPSASWEVASVEEAGGLLRAARRGDRRLTATLPTHTTVRVQSGDSSLVKDAAVTLVEGMLSVSIASGGVADFGLLPPGRWTVRLASPLLDSLDVSSPTREIEVWPDRPTVIEWSLPKFITIARACSAVGDPTYAGIVQGQLTGIVGGSYKDVDVRVVYARLDEKALRSGIVRRNDQELRLKSDVNGRWRACGLPRGGDATITATLREQSWKRTVRVDPDRPFTRMALELIPYATVATVATSTNADTLSATSKAAGGFVVSRAEMMARRLPVVWQYLRSAPGLRLITYGDGVYATSSRTSIESLETARPCVVTVLVDGVRLVPRASLGIDLRELPMPEIVERITVYDGATSVPIALASMDTGSRCGMIVVETRR